MKGKKPPAVLNSDGGFTMVELTVVVAIIVVLTAVIMPVAEKGIKRSKELELRRKLRTLRTAIDRYHLYAMSGLISKLDMEEDDRFYPDNLEVLVEGVDAAQGIDKKFKFLRRIPKDPMTGKKEWGKRSYQDEWDTTSWGRENVYDVYSLSEGKGLNGTPYKEW